MEIVKKNLISIICGVVALVAIAVAFTLLTGKAAELQSELNARKQAHDQLASLLHKDRELPKVKLEDGPADRLTKFPSQRIIDQGDAIVKKVDAESKAMLAAAVAMNKHAPLEPGSLPAPDQTAAFRFREHYQVYFPPNLSPSQGQLAKDFSAGMPPTQEEIRQKVEEKAKEIRITRTRSIAGQPSNEPQVTAEIAEMARKLPDQLRTQIATQSKVYINPQTFTPYPAILVGANAPDAVDIYLAQLTLWLQQDVVAAVNDANKGATSIKDATVKHLIKVTVPPWFVMPATGTPGIDPNAAAPREPAISPTGRVSNGMYDVCHINIDADIDAAKLPEFLRALGRKRFITPLWVDIKSVDSALEMAAGHDYGPSPVINVKVQCEVLYLRAWDRLLMPQKVRVKLGLPPVEEAPKDTAVPPAETPAAPPQ